MRIQRLIHFVLSGLSPISRFAVRSAERVTKANIVFILADDLGYGDLKCYNAQSKISKPNLDQHAESSSVCMPTDRRHRKQSAIVASYLVSLLCLVSARSSGAETIEFTTTYLKMSVDGTGGLSTLEDRASGVNYLPKEQPAPLLMLYRDSEAIAPKAMEFDRAHSLISLMYPNGSKATIKAETKGDYLRLELLSVEPRNGVGAVGWGPYPTTINKLIGDTICVVRDEHFAIGLQALNLFTIEGTPLENLSDNAGGGSVIDPLPGQTVPDFLKDRIGKPFDARVNKDGDQPACIRTYRGNAAVKKGFGSEVRLFARDRRTSRVLGTGNGMRYVEAVDRDFVGSAIAFFGCPEPKTLDVIEKIELEEGLPHPTLDGVWIKRSPRLGEAYMAMHCSAKTIDIGLEYARKCGFRMIHLGEIFSSRGHFGLTTKRFPNGVADIREIVRKAKDQGVTLGVHTLTMFTGANDAYVSPVPSDQLCKTGSSKLTKDAGAADDVIYIESPDFLRNLGSTRTAKIGKELISYRAVSDNTPWRLLDCQRGVHQTAATAHKAGETIDKLANNSYNGYYPDIHLQDSYARRLAEVCNETGLGLMDFDGFAGESPTGHGIYGASKFIDLWQKSLNKSVINCAAGTFHYYWHIATYMNWGEPWYNELRQSQVNYRAENQRYFERNLMPGMLGWFHLKKTYRPEDVEWIQARSAGFNAGYQIGLSEAEVEPNGFKEELFSAIKEWQNARRAGAFPETL